MDIAPFTLRRRVGWGECDPARIYYTPRAIDYAVEAVEAWCAKILKTPWSELFHEHGLDFPYRHIECSYLRPLRASQVVRVRLWVVWVGRASVGFRILGDDEKGEVCFCANLTACFVDRKNYCSKPIPPNFLTAIVNYRNFCIESSGVYSDKGNILRASKSCEEKSRLQTVQHLIPSAEIAREKSFTIDRRVVSGDCAASGTLYAPRGFDYAVEAVGEWYEAIPGISWMDLVCRRNLGAPFVSAACRYLHPLLPGETVTLGVQVMHLGGASLSFSVSGLNTKGTLCFDVKLGACFIDGREFKAVRIPAEFRGPIEEYMLACGTGQPTDLNRAQ